MQSGELRGEEENVLAKQEGGQSHYSGNEIKSLLLVREARLTAPEEDICGRLAQTRARLTALVLCHGPELGVAA